MIIIPQYLILINKLSSRGGGMFSRKLVYAYGFYFCIGSTASYPQPPATSHRKRELVVNRLRFLPNCRRARRYYFRLADSTATLLMYIYNQYLPNYHPLRAHSDTRVVYPPSHRLFTHPRTKFTYQVTSVVYTFEFHLSSSKFTFYYVHEHLPHNQYLLSRRNQVTRKHQLLCSSILQDQ